MDASQLSLDDIARRCEEETENYRRKRAVDTRYCFELFRRALEDHIQDAFTYIFRIYQPQCARWARSFAGFGDTDESTPDVFISEAFARLFRDLSGEKFSRFASLESVLAYLKKCVITAILQHLRKIKTVQLEFEVEEAFETTIEQEQIWQRICQLLPDRHDQELMDYRFRQDMKPTEIALRYSGQWASAREVSVALQRLVRTLRKDQELRSLVGLERESSA